MCHLKKSLTALVIIVLLLIVSIPTPSVKAGINIWTGGGPFGAIVRSMAIDPSTPSTIYAGTGGAGIYKSTDSGNTWTAMGLAPYYVDVIAINPDDPEVVAAAIADIIQISYDGGLHWAPFYDGLPGNEILCLTFTPITGETLYAGTEYGGVYKRSGTDLAWSAFNDGLSGQGLYVEDIEIDPTDNTAYIATYGGGVLKRGASDSTWTAVNTGLPNNCIDQDCYLYDIDFDTTTSPRTIFIATWGAGVFYSTDGTSWTTFGNSGISNTYLWTMALDTSTTPSTVYVGSYDGVDKSQDGTWTTVNSGLTNTYVACLVAKPSAPGVLFVGTDGGLFKTVNSGNSWSLKVDGIINSLVDEILIDPMGYSTVYASVKDSGVFKSQDSGRTWIQINEGLGTLSIYSLASSGETLFAGGSTGLYRSNNGGTSWTYSNLHKDICDIAVDPVTPTTLYVGTCSFDTVWKSTDLGDTWGPANSGLPAANTMSVKIDPADPNILYAAMFGSGVYKSVDGGTSWQEKNTGIVSKYTLELVIDPAGNIYARDWDDDVSISTNGGDTWGLYAPVIPGVTILDIRSIAFDPLGVIYLSTTEGLFKSEDDGLTWTNISSGLPPTYPTELAIYPNHAAIIYAGTNAMGVYHINQVIFSDYSYLPLLMR